MRTRGPGGRPRSKNPTLLIIQGVSRKGAARAVIRGVNGHRKTTTEILHGRAEGRREGLREAVGFGRVGAARGAAQEHLLCCAQRFSERTCLPGARHAFCHRPCLRPAGCVCAEARKHGGDLSQRSFRERECVCLSGRQACPMGGLDGRYRGPREASRSRDDGADAFAGMVS